jgi:hypothetical protein
VSRTSAAPDALSSYLLETARSFDGESTTVREILERVGERGMLVICIVLCVPFLVPVSIPGVSTVFGFAIAVTALALSLRRLPWLPRRMLDRQVATAKLREALEAGAARMAKLERLLRPRIRAVAALARLNALLLAFAGILLMAPFGLIPFSNTVPAVAAILLGLGMLHRDGAFVLAGYAAILATLLYFGVLIGAAIWGGMELGAALGD